MYAKSFLALDGNGHLTGATTAQIYPYDRYTCHLCGSALVFHPEWDTNRPWFEHTTSGLTGDGQHCPYVNPDTCEVRLVKRLQQWLPGALAVVHKADWHCTNCNSDYYGERYCLTCRTGEHSHRLPDAEKRTAEVTSCVC
ncbi:hypothetical protein KK671_005086 [Salmonella enterica subsp. enterica serovar Muenchen]|uniref:DNA-directed RNA polymerase, beta subunit/140 kD subunit n=2 Tax=Salmonella enterica TaxID=28901 RepID=A0A744KER6_SALER|nr:hypothetical protein [Salmonella enterica subsp. enterica serovar Newport]EBV8518941.1 hypothetical protein [Salmonella enterica subsp. enterica serovar Larochelle]EBW7446490.1 hypothetical protein [Salmonella enterica subsp. enterica serovar Muenchen]ECA3795192.1 hypothetical protein [Salmonella enterica subsp. enterica serovar Aqua]EDC1399159.1 hypothetical protein [Salmonella enterica subsp. enterica serovar Panama]EDS8889920.1 hypothetical protein [Salmonella enterica]